MKKRLLLSISMLILLLYFSLPVAADIGPKPSVVVNFESLGSEQLLRNAAV